MKRLSLSLAALTAAVGLGACGGSHHAQLPTVPQTTTVQADQGHLALHVPKAAAHDVSASLAGDHLNLQDETPSGVTPAEVRAAHEQQAQLYDPSIPKQAPLAAPSQAGCTFKGVRNFSSRNGVHPRIIVLHYTVSSNRSGWGDVDAIVSWFNNPAAQASSNYVVDNEGHCAYIVPESLKAWAQAGFNSVALSIEVVNTGHEPTYAGTAGLAKLGRVVHDMAKRWGIPLRHGAVSGCTVTRSGIVTHHQLGSCGGGHFDIDPYSYAPVIRAAQAAGGSTSSDSKWDESNFHLSVLTPEEKANAKTLLYQRRVAERHGGWSKIAASHLAAAVKAKHWLQARNLLLHALARQSGWARAARASRHRVIHALI